MMVFL
jgi:transposase